MFMVNSMKRLKQMDKMQRIYILIMFILLIASEILLSIDDITCRIVGMICVPFILVVGFIMLKDQK
jgi:hypothetical protein